MIKSLFILILSILTSSTAHLFLKKGISQFNFDNYPEFRISTHIIDVATNPWVFSGMTLHGTALVFWLWALSRVDISFAYPFLALGYVFIGIMAWVWLGESLSLIRISGMLLIIAGLVVLSQSA